MCPHTLVRMPAPVPCRFGSEASFASEEARAEAEGSYHAHEWKVAKRLREAGLAPVGRLALRLVTSGKCRNVTDIQGGLSDHGSGLGGLGF